MKINDFRPHSSLRLRSAGFTLLEMVIVLGIIAMILGGAIFSMTKIGDAAKIGQAEADFKAFDNALAMYQLNAGHFPSTQQGLKALTEKPNTNPKPRRWAQVMKNVPKDPWGAEYLYKYPGSKRANEYEIISIGPDGLPNTDDDLSSQDEQS